MSEFLAQRAPATVKHCRAATLPANQWSGTFAGNFSEALSGSGTISDPTHANIGISGAGAPCPGNPGPSGSITSDCTPAGILTVGVTASDNDGTPGVTITGGSVAIPQAIGTHVSPGSMPAPPRNNILYTLTLTVRDVQQPAVTITRT